MGKNEKSYMAAVKKKRIKEMNESSFPPNPSSLPLKRHAGGAIQFSINRIHCKSLLEHNEAKRSMVEKGKYIYYRISNNGSTRARMMERMV